MHNHDSKNINVTTLYRCINSDGRTCRGYVQLNFYVAITLHGVRTVRLSLMICEGRAFLLKVPFLCADVL